MSCTMRQMSCCIARMQMKCCVTRVCLTWNRRQDSGPSRRKSTRSNNYCTTAISSSTIGSSRRNTSKAPTQTPRLADTLHKTNDVKKLQAELHASEKANKDLVRANRNLTQTSEGFNKGIDDLRNASESWERTAHSIKPAMAFLIRTLRGLQQSLSKFLTAVTAGRAHYGLSWEQRSGISIH